MNFVFLLEYLKLLKNCMLILGFVKWNIAISTNHIIGTVGPGGSPDENGETTIDALVMDGVSSTHIFLLIPSFFLLLVPVKVIIFYVSC